MKETLEVIGMMSAIVMSAITIVYSIVGMCLVCKGKIEASKNELCALFITIGDLAASIILLVAASM